MSFYFALAESNALLANAQAAKNDALLANAPAASAKDEGTEKEENTLVNTRGTRFWGCGGVVGGWRTRNTGLRLCLLDYMGENGERETGIMAELNAELRVEDRALLSERRRHRHRRRRLEYPIQGNDDSPVEMSYTDQEREEADRAALSQRARRLHLAEGNAALQREEKERELRRKRRRPLRPIKTAKEGFERRRLGRGMDRDDDIGLKLLRRWKRAGGLIDPVSSETEVGVELERILFRNLKEGRGKQACEDRLLEYCRRTQANYRIHSRHQDRNYGARALMRELEIVWMENLRGPDEPSCWDPKVLSDRVIYCEHQAFLNGEAKRGRGYFRRPYPFEIREEEKEKKRKMERKKKREERKRERSEKRERQQQSSSSSCSSDEGDVSV
jgi:hypothetical protein